MSNRLPVLAGQIAELASAIDHHSQQAAEKAVALGASLCEAKELCGHGGWGAFLKGCGVSDRSAQRYMRLHRTGFESATVADLGIATADRHARLVERIADAGDASLEAVFSLPNGNRLFSTFWQYRAGEYFLAGWDHSTAEEPHAYAVAYKKPLTPFGAAAVHDHWRGASARLIEARTIENEDAEWWFGALGLTAERRSWGTRLCGWEGMA